MALIGAITLDSQPGQEPLAAVPEMVLHLEDMRHAADGRWRVIFWASGDDFEAYEAALDSHPTIASYQRLADLPDRRQYRLTFVEGIEQDVLHSVVIEHDVTLVEVTMTADELYFLARFPSREALAGLRAAALERGMTFRLERLYEENDAANDGGVEGRFGVTEPQREALLAALESGYFEVPRETTLDAVAERLDLSTSALSTRVRRGLENLLRATLATEGAT